MDKESGQNLFLADAIIALKTRAQAQNFLRDLLTAGEIEEFTRRLRAAKMLSEKRPYSSIIKATGLSSTTVARVSKFLKCGYGGYKTVIGPQHHGRTLREETGGD